MNEIREKLRQAYNRTAPKRDTESQPEWKLVERAKFLAVLMAEQKDSLLEIGAGTGLDSVYFQAHGLAVTCIDFSPEMIKLCVQKGLEAQVMDVSKLKFPEAAFDAVYSMNCLLHIPKEELPQVLRNIQTILKPTGLFYLGMHGGIDFEGIWEEDGYEPKRFFSLYQDEDLHQVVSEFFEIRAFEPLVVDPTNTELHFQALLLQKVEA